GLLPRRGVHGGRPERRVGDLVGAALGVSISGPRRTCWLGLCAVRGGRRSRACCSSPEPSCAGLGQQCFAPTAKGTLSVQEACRSHETHLQSFLRPAVRSEEHTSELQSPDHL